MITAKDFRRSNFCGPLRYYLIFDDFFSGSFPLSEVSLLSEEERDQYIPTITTFKRVLDDSLANDGPDPKDINLLVDKCKEFSKLFPQSPCTKINPN